MVDYIQIKSGYDINAIRQVLIQQGYSQKIIDESILSINNQGQIAKSKVGGDKMVDMTKPEYKGFWIRLLASILDGIIIGIPTFLLQLGLVYATGISSMMYLVSLATLIVIIYFDGVKGGTPGKLILGMRIVNEKGEYIGIPMAILRYIGKILSGIILGIGHFMIAWDSKKQGLQDKIAKTYVVKV